MFVLSLASFASFALACVPPESAPSSSPASSKGPDLAPALVSSSFAAMDELPAQGGELRLAEPIEIEIEVEVAISDGTAVPIEDDEDNAATDDREQTPATKAVTAIAFPLKHTDVDVDVSGMIGLFTVTQQFENPFDRPLEAVYVFPLGAKAAVVDYEIIVGDRTIKGVVETRGEARRVYNEAKRAGQTAALLEQEKPNVFTQRVTGIAPNETVSVRFKYVEMLEHRDGNVTLTYPMVVGPRYLPSERIGRSPVGAHVAGSSAPPGRVSVPYVDANVPSSKLSFRARVDAGVPIVALESPTHSIRASSVSETIREVRLADGAVIPNKDLVLRYSAAGGRTMIGAMAHRAQGQEGYFSLVVQPKALYRQSDVRSREVILLIDKSGSMRGASLAQAKALAKSIVATLNKDDVFNVISFASGTTKLDADVLSGDDRGRKAGAAFIDAIRPGGGTEMEAGILSSLASVPGSDRVRMVYVLSDGFVGNDDVILGAAKKYLGHNRIYPIGIGSSPNRYLFDRLGDAGRGFTSYLIPGDEPSELAGELVRRSARPYLTDLSIDWSGLGVVDVTPARLPDIHAGIPLVVTGRYSEPGSATIKLKARAGNRPIEIPLAIALPHTADREAIRYLWARNRIDELMHAEYGEVGSSAEREVTELGLEHQMVTAFTSFIAIDRSRSLKGPGRKLVQPVSVPEGVSLESAVGPAPAQSASPRASRSRRSSGGGGGGGGGWGGGDTDPFTLLYLLLLLPSILALRRLRTA